MKKIGSTEENLERINESLGILNAKLNELNSSLKEIQSGLQTIVQKQTDIANYVRGS